MGVIASLAILALGIALDRVTQGNRRPQERLNGQQPSGQQSSGRNAVQGGSHVESSLGARRPPRGGLRPRRSPRGARGRRHRTGAERQASCGTVTLNEQAWAGSTANTYVAKYVLEDKLGCKVKITKIAEIPVYQAMANGKVDAVLEDWQHVDQYKQYVDEAASRSSWAGRTASTGHIGWFIPKYLMEQHPEFKTWKGLKGKENLFKTPESGDQGMFLGGDPSYVQKDKELIQALGLNFKFVTVGAEPAQVARWSQLYKQKKPVIFYWYTPQYLNAAVRPLRGQAPGALQGLQGRRQGGRRPEAVQVRVRRDRSSRSCSARSSRRAARRRRRC